MEKIFLVKVPIFDMEENVYGFEIKYEFEEKEEEDFNLVIQKLYATLSDIDIIRNAENKPVFIKLSSEIVIFTDFTTLLPPEHFIVSISHSNIKSKALLDKLLELKLKGYKFCLSNINIDELTDEIVSNIEKTIEYIEISNNSLKFEKDETKLERIKKLPFNIIIDDVDDYLDFKNLKTRGFRLFKGEFFTKPENIQVNIEKISKLETLRLIRIVNEEEELNTIAEYIKAYPSISVNLLKYINSSFFYLANPIVSVNRAVAYLGKRNLINWLVFLSMLSVANKDTKKESIKKALFRGKFLELTSKKINSDENIAEIGFFVGILSLTEAVFNVPLEEILKELNLNQTLATEIKERKGYFGKLLSLVELIEKNKTKETKNLAEDLMLDSQEIAQTSIDALKWSENMFMSLYR